MPFTGNDQLPKGVKSLPPEKQTKWRKIFNSAYEGTCKERKDRDECAAKIAWSQMKSIVEMSMVITKASLDPTTGEMRWSAVASDTDEDTYQETMSLRLFNAFIRNAQTHMQPPGEHCTDFWCGGMPYLSIAHYRDQNGLAVPGEVKKLYVDGNRLKSSGIFYDTPLGRSAFKSVRESKEDPSNEKVRISIGFLDFEHSHGDTVFRRKSVADVCPLCLMGENSKQYLDGMLIHLALTRVPVNRRTIIQAEVDKSMADDIRTRKDDAASIVGDELAEELEKRAATSVMKSEAELVIKSDGEDMEECEEGDEECKKKMKDKKDQEKSEIPVAQEEKSEPEMGIMMMPYGGATSWEQYDGYIAEKEASQAIYDSWYTMEVLAQNIMMNDACTDKKKAMLQLLGGCKKRMEMKSLIVLSKLEDFDPSNLVAKSEPIPAHPLDESIGDLKSALDEIAKSDSPVIEKLQAVQPVYAKLGESVKAIIEQSEVKLDPVAGDATPDQSLTELRSEIRSLRDEVGLLTSKLSASSGVSVVQGNQPPHRNMAANAQVMRSIQSLANDKPRKLRDIIRDSVGLRY